MAGEPSAPYCGWESSNRSPTNLCGTSCRTSGRAGRVSSTADSTNRFAHASRLFPRAQARANRRGFSAATAFCRSAFCHHARMRLSSQPTIPLVFADLRSTKTRLSSANFTSACSAMNTFSLHCVPKLPSGPCRLSLPIVAMVNRRRTPRAWHLPPTIQPLQTHRFADSQTRRIARRVRAEGAEPQGFRCDGRGQRCTLRCPLRRVGTRLTPHTELRSRFYAE